MRKIGMFKPFLFISAIVAMSGITYFSFVYFLFFGFVLGLIDVLNSDWIKIEKDNEE